MKFSSARGALEEALSMVAPIATTQSPIDALSNVMLAPYPNGIVKVYASNGSTTAVTLFAADVEDAKSMAFPADKLLKWVSGVEGTRVSVRPKGDTGRLLFKSGRSQVTVAPQINQDLALFTVGELDPGARELFTVDREWFFDALGRASISAAKRNTSLPILEGIQFLAEGADLNLISTDSYRFSYLRQPNNYARHFDFVCHMSEIKHLRRIIKANAEFEEVICYEIDNAIYFQVGEVTLRMVRMQGQYPEIQTMIADQISLSSDFIEVEQDKILSCLKRITLFSDDNISAAATIRVAGSTSEEVNFEDVADLIVMGGSQEIGISKDILSVASYGKPWRMALNAGFLHDAVKSVDGPVVRLTRVAFGNGRSIHVSTATEDGVEPNQFNFMMALDDSRIIQEDN